MIKQTVGTLIAMKITGQETMYMAFKKLPTLVLILKSFREKTNPAGKQQHMNVNYHCSTCSHSHFVNKITTNDISLTLNITTKNALYYTSKLSVHNKYTFFLHFKYE